MPGISRKDITKILYSFICDTFPVVRQKPISVTDRLLEQGIVDSLGALEIVDFIETTFNITVRVDDLVIENFASIAALAALVSHSLEESQGDSQEESRSKQLLGTRGL